ncbi:hypothetical protein ACU686_39660 [Yinghuangia aomiensis]
MPNGAASPTWPRTPSASTCRIPRRKSESHMDRARAAGSTGRRLDALDKIAGGAPGQEHPPRPLPRGQSIHGRPTTATRVLLGPP